jgi:prepilin-type processing-associated H-X9-DG protein
MSNLRQMGTAIQMYAQANQGRLPIYYWDGTADQNVLPGKTTGPGTDWAWLILPYLKKGSIGDYSGTDPDAIWKVFKDKDTLSGDYRSTAFTYNSEEVQTYSVHPTLFQFSPGPLRSDLTNAGGAKPGSADDGKKPFKLQQIKRSSDIIMVMDAVQFGDGLDARATNSWTSDADMYYMQGDATQRVQFWATMQYCVTTFPKGPDAGFNKDYATHAAMFEDTDGLSSASQMRFRHIKNKVANALFVDGHVGSFKWNHPGLGGSDVQWKNIILDDQRRGDLVFAPGQGG